MKQIYFLLSFTLVVILSASTHQAVAQQSAPIAAGDSVKYVAYVMLPMGAGGSIAKAQLAIATSETLGTDVANALLFKAQTATTYNLVADNPNKNNLDVSQQDGLRAVLNLTDFVPAKGYFTNNGGSMGLSARLPGTYSLVLPRSLSKTGDKWWLLITMAKSNGALTNQFVVPFYLAQ